MTSMDACGRADVGAGREVFVRDSISLWRGWDSDNPLGPDFLRDRAGFFTHPGPPALQQSKKAGAASPAADIFFGPQARSAGPRLPGPDVKTSIITIFPEFFPQALGVGILGRALGSGLMEVELIDLRDYAEGVHRAVDDAPFGGGPGMVMMPGPLARALDPLESSHRVLFAPVGRRLDQSVLDRWSKLDHLTLVCGRYEGVDERIAEHFIDEEISVGDFVLAGGEVAALLVLEGVVRLLPEAVGNPRSVMFESFREGLLEEPVYTRPATFRGWSVPEVLLSGNHRRIADWRSARRWERTRRRRPDLRGGDS